jgi:hypothetical protein
MREYAQPGQTTRITGRAGPMDRFRERVEATETTNATHGYVRTAR